MGGEASRKPNVVPDTRYLQYVGFNYPSCNIMVVVGLTLMIVVRLTANTDPGGKPILDKVAVMVICGRCFKVVENVNGCFCRCWLTSSPSMSIQQHLLPGRKHFFVLPAENSATSRI